MITAEDAVALCAVMSKYQTSLEKQVEREKLFQKKYPHYKASHEIREKAYQDALDTFKSIVGVGMTVDVVGHILNNMEPDRAECGCLADDVNSVLCECCQVITTFCNCNEYGTCMCS